MKFLFLAYIRSDNKQLFYKVDDQVLSIKEQHPESEGVIVGEGWDES